MLEIRQVCVEKCDYMRVLNRHQYQIASNDTQPCTYVTYCMYVCVSFSITITFMSALISALSLSKCHLVSFIFRSFTKKSNLRWRRYVTSKTLNLTVCFFFFNRCCFVYFNIFKIPFSYFGSMQHYKVILRTQTRLQSKITCWKKFYVKVLLIIQWALK